MRALVKRRLFPVAAPDFVASGLDLLATAVLLLDRDGRIAYVNPAAENLFELSRTKFVRHTLDDVFGRRSPLA